MKAINYKQFKKEWFDAMVYRPHLFDDLEQFMQDQYVIYKEDDPKSGCFQEMYDVDEFCEFFYLDADLDTHPYMIKRKALESKHVKGLIDLINRNKK